MGKIRLMLVIGLIFASNSSHAGHWRLVNITQKQPATDNRDNGKTKGELVRCKDRQETNPYEYVCTRLTAKSHWDKSSRYYEGARTLDPMPTIIEPGKEFNIRMKSGMFGVGKAFTDGSSGLRLIANVWFQSKDTGKYDVRSRRVTDVSPWLGPNWPINGIKTEPSKYKEIISSTGTFTGGRWYPTGNFEGGLSWMVNMKVNIDDPDARGKGFVVNFVSSFVQNGRIQYWYKWVEGAPVSTKVTRNQRDVNTYVPSPEAPLSETTSKSKEGQFFEPGIDRPGADYKDFDLAQPNPFLCGNYCNLDNRCQAWTYVVPGHQGAKARCWLKHSVPAAEKSNCCTSGVKK